MHIAAHFCRLYLSFIEKGDKTYVLKWLQFGRLVGIYSRKEVYDLSFKEFLLDVLDRTVNASWYRSVGCSPDEASFLADMEANTAFFKQSEKRNPSSALTERHCNLSEEKRNTERPETLENICAASGDVDAYIAEKAKTDARYSAVQKEFQRIDASKTALEERRRKLREENPWIYEEAEKFRQEAIRIREEAKKQKQ